MGKGIQGKNLIKAKNGRESFGAFLMGKGVWGKKLINSKMVQNWGVLDGEGRPGQKINKLKKWSKQLRGVLDGEKLPGQKFNKCSRHFFVTFLLQHTCPPCCV